MRGGFLWSRACSPAIRFLEPERERVADRLDPDRGDHGDV